MKISENFTLQELTKSATAKSRGLTNQPTAQHQKNLVELVNNILQPLRTALGRSIDVTSGYRSHELNNAVGGSKTSQHSLGQAADIVVQGMTPKQVCEKIIELGLPFDQLIEEFGRWVHVSYDPSRNRKQVLTARTVNNKTVYSKGLV
jgi:zinc D-Ala-D-Ala carboxypeptidase